MRSLTLFFLLSFSVGFSQPSPVLLEGDTLYVISNWIGIESPKDRANAINSRIEQFLEDPSFTTDSLTVEFNTGDTIATIRYSGNLLLRITRSDAITNGKPLAEIARSVKEQLGSKADKEQLFRSVTETIFQILSALLVTGIFVFLIRLFNRTYSKIQQWIDRQKDRWTKPITISTIELVSVDKIDLLLRSISKSVRWVIYLAGAYFYLTLVFSLFPFTRNWAGGLVNLIFLPISKTWSAIVEFFPDFVSIVVILFLFRYVLRLNTFFFREVKKGAIQLPGFYPDWADTTRQLVQFLLVILVVIVIYPLLPGTDSAIGQGVTIFVGALISFGSSSAISNAIAGVVITYMRPFQKGDRIQTGEVKGDVMEKGILVTRIRTIKNEEITVPNSVILNQAVVNYSKLAKTDGLILHTTVTIGYDVSWRLVHQLLINAALKCQQVNSDPKPFVLQTSLDDFYVSYQLNFYTREASGQASIYSEVHKNIQDEFASAGVEIMSPHYRAERDGNPITIPSTQPGSPL